MRHPLLLLMGGSQRPAFNPANLPDLVDIWLASTLSGVEGDLVTTFPGKNGAAWTPQLTGQYPKLRKGTAFNDHAYIEITDGRGADPQNGMVIPHDQWPALQDAPLTMVVVTWQLHNINTGAAFTRGDGNNRFGDTTTSGRGATLNENFFSVVPASDLSSGNVYVEPDPFADGIGVNTPEGPTPNNPAKPMTVVYTTNGNTAAGMGYEAIWYNGVKVAERGLPGSPITLKPMDSNPWELGGGSEFTTNQYIAMAAIYNTQWADDKIIQVDTWAHTEYNRAIRFVAIGDSIFVGYLVTAGQQWHISLANNLANSIVYQGGITGKTATDQSAYNAVGYTNPSPPPTYIPITGQGNGFSADGMASMTGSLAGNDIGEWVVGIGGCFNDFHYLANGDPPDNDISVDSIRAAIQYMIDTTKAAGGLPLLFCMHDVNEAHSEWTINSYTHDHNAWLLAKVGTGEVKACVRWDTIPGGQGAPTYGNETTYTYDGIHPSDRTQPWMYRRVLMALRILFAGTSQAASVPAPGVPVVPMDLAATPGNNQVALTWTALDDPVCYNVQRATASSGPYILIKSAIYAATYTDSTAVNDTQYYYQISATIPEGDSSYTEYVVAKPEPPIPSAPTSFAGVATNSQVAFTWDAMTYAATYNLKRSTTNGSGYVTIHSQSGTSYTDTGLTNGTTYYYVVTAVNTGGESVNSTQLSETPSNASRLTFGLTHAWTFADLTDSVGSDNFTLSGSAALGTSGPAGMPDILLSGGLAVLGSTVTLPSGSPWALSTKVWLDSDGGVNGMFGYNTQALAENYFTFLGLTNYLVRDNSPNTIVQAISGGVSFGTWHTATFSSDGSTMSLYFDGTLQGTGTAVGPWILEAIGAADVDAAYAISGRMASTNVWNRALLTAEVTQLNVDTAGWPWSGQP